MDRSNREVSLLKSQSPHPERAIAPRVFHLNLHAIERALAPRIFHLNHHAIELALVPRVFHLNHHVIGQALAPDHIFSELKIKLAQSAGLGMVNSAHFTLVSCRRAGHGSPVPARRLALAGIRPAIEARSRDHPYLDSTSLAVYKSERSRPPGRPAGYPACRGIGNYLQRIPLPGWNGRPLPSR